jgi:hypothetical protein
MKVQEIKNETSQTSANAGVSWGFGDDVVDDDDNGGDDDIPG